MLDKGGELMDAVKLRAVCRIGLNGETCRYLGVGPDGFQCLKNDPSLKGMIDARVATGTFNAQGDNCEGEGE